jgi:alkaline phosphatase
MRRNFDGSPDSLGEGAQMDQHTILYSAKHAHWLFAFALLAALAFLFTSANADVGDPVSRVECSVGYSPSVYAEGLASPDGLAISPDGILYVSEEAAGRVSRVDPYGRVTSVIDGLDAPEGIAFDDIGNLYTVEDVSEGRLVKMTPEGLTTTLAANLDAPEGVAWASDGTLYITESNVQFAPSPLNFRTHVTAISPGGYVTRVLTSTLFWSYAGITIGPDGSLYVTNEASGTGTNDSVFVVDPVTGERSLFVSGLVAPEGLSFSADGGFPLYVAEEDSGGGGGRLSRVETDGTHTALCTGFSSIEDVVVDAYGTMYVSEDGTGSIIRVEPITPARRTRPSAIILFIGDGMGEEHRVAGRWSAVGPTGALAMDAMSFGGWSRTASANSSVTDSAAAAAAMATGVKTNNGVISQSPDGYRLMTILERAKAQGMAVGLVTNVQMTHATPAAFAAHVPSRAMMTEIASQMLEAGVDVMLGGGEDEFLPTTATGCYSQPGERTDGRDLVSEAESNGYSYVCNASELASIDPSGTTHLLGLFADEGMVRPFSPSLAEMAQKAIDILSQDPDGFFLMVEGGQIDWAAHDNLAADVISDTVGLDEAITAAKAFAAVTGDVLVIVTADHETGGMRVDLTSNGTPEEDGPFLMPGGTSFFVNWLTAGHTGVDVPTTAHGPWSDMLVGAYENTYIHDVMRLALERQRLYLPLSLRSFRTRALAPSRR